MALAAGDVLGLLRAPAVSAGSGSLALMAALAGLGCVAAGRSLRGRSGLPREAPRLETLFLIGFSLLAGSGLGIRAGASAARSCAAALETGDPTVAAGVLLDRVPAAAPNTAGNPAPRTTVRARLGRVTLVSGGRRCRLPRVRAYVRLGPEVRAAGAPVWVRGNWRRYDPSDRPRATDAYGWVGSASVEPVPGPAPRRLSTGLAAWRGGLVDRLERRLPESAGLGAALLLADRGGLEPDTRRVFVDAGIVHLLAISGLHVGLIGAGLAWLIGLRVRGPRRLGYAALAVGLYVLLIGSPPSAVRASLIFAGHAAAGLRGLPARLGDLGALAAILAILANPLVIADVGFQLSFAGFAGVVLGARLGRRAPTRGRRARRACEALGASVGAFLATAPLAAVHFDRIVLASIPASLLATGLVALTIPGLALTVLLPQPLAGLFAPAAELLLAALGGIARLFAAMPLRWTAPSPLAWFLLAAVLAMSLDRASRRRARPVWASGIVLAGVLAGPPLAAWRARGEALVCSLDVGQGDAAVIRTGAGRWVVLDAGPGNGFGGTGSAMGGPPADRRFGDAGRHVLVPFLRARGARAIELFALSHPHLDHFGGGAALFDAFPVRRVLDPAVPEPSASYAALLERVREEGAVWLPGLAGDRLRVDDVSIEVLWPPEPTPSDANAGSLALRISVGDLRFLTTGDAPTEVEEAILAREGPRALEADLLKIGHHGSRTSTSRTWLHAVRPRLVIISAGRGNRHGHPHPEVLARIDSTRARIWRTDRDGTMCVAVREGSWRLLERV